MPLIVPVLDDRGFEQLRKELVDRIRVFNPEWTDHNRSDPAITLLELFAYLGEGLQFRFNQIPEATQLAFLRLLDLPLLPARAATALLRCRTQAAGGVAVYGGDQVKAGKTVFTVRHDASLWPLDCVAVARQRLLAEDSGAALQEFVQGLDEELHVAVQASIDAIAAAQPGVEQVAPYRNAVLEPDASTRPVDFANTVDGCVWIAVLKDYPEPASPATHLQLAPGRALSLSLGFAPASEYPLLEEVQACPGTGGRRAPSLEWRASALALKADGTPRYLPVRVAGDTSGGFTQEGVLRLELPADLAQLGVPAAPPELAGSGEFPPVLDDDRAERLWFWLRAWRGDASRIGPVKLLTLNALAVEQSVAALPELLGGGNGQPGQQFQLSNRPLLPDARYPVELQVEESGVWADWQQREDLDASDALDRHFTVDAEAGTVHFGERFPQIGERVRVMKYRHGGGAVGNVPPGAISKFGDLAGPPPVPPMQRPGSDVKLSNPLPAQGGVDGESLEAALRRIPGELRRRGRAVTRDDFRELAMMTPGVELGRAECLPLFHAPDRSSPRAGTVSVMVWPARDAAHPNAPVPDRYQLRRVCEWLDTKRLITTELFVIPPTYRRIAIALAVKVRDGYGLDAVRDWVELILRQYLAPLPPYGPEGGGWPLGRRVLDRELEGVAMQVEGVEYVEGLRLAGFQAGAWQELQAVPMMAWEVPEVAAVSVVDEQTPVPDPARGIGPPPTTPAVAVPVFKEEC
ncbi:putative baseplate assembly protein [Pseudoduganella namucuonensis]|uniref:Putative baseplate assembly protein n=1 Tax=Pseudoduganella namucuonensis TaxID=1035707 RepID=A0A1I7M4S3_9BURK|nr:putative baseplate assembly protein [Pseudoduganella namucuonensis]SFV16946.1 putative baseplate assembly protein [Pseudoduganella namucuonensis]